ncbi:asparagine synthase (glutamine-hydrolyzing) [Arenibaculum pallidiluteum]|uniref:asparagine synthase (glutamine-hydrolyzing) n=1 Tax=Arenibaculum pallidiluteum TaxID=2812559 RepID=UPI001A9589EB|nr:asparagine synthase (glutamine-hydrolyzing) [Arenibaculum pallidiluteum]
MCGIAGIVARHGGLEVGRLIREMTTRVRHRGPDDEGWLVEGRVALGHRRLAILDLSAAGHQPMTSADGRFAITYNGEIYNFIELRSELEAMGHRFRTGTDTEVVLTAFAAWGPECLARLNGMWSFAIHDRLRRTIFASRDRFGEKPFYYVRTEACFAFGSEIRQLLPLLPSTRANAALVADFLLTGSPAQSTETFFEGVSSLAAGHFLVYDIKADRCAHGRYYSLAERLAAADPSPAEEPVAALRRTFEDAVRLRLRSDVQVGACLSGGLDSSSISLIAARQNARAGARFNAVTAISEDPRNNEETYAAEVVKAGDLRWITTRPGYDDFRALLPHVVEHQEEPFPGPSICMQAFVMRAARENGVVVLLDGQGGDETLLGYERYCSPYCYALWREKGILEAIRGAREAIRNTAGMSAWRLIAQSLLWFVPAARYRYFIRRGRYLSPRPALPGWVGSFARSCLDVRALQILEMEATGLPALLRYEDKNSMAYSVEARLPFLDHRLVEQCISLEPQLKMQGGWTKWVLRRAMADLLPEGIAWRRNKIGFAAPTDLWLARHRDVMARAVTTSPLIARFCDQSRLTHQFGALDRDSQWRLYSLALWEERFSVAV